MLKCARIGNSCALNTKKTFILLFDFILPIFKSFQKSPAICTRKLFFFKKVNCTSFSKFQGLFNAKNLKKNFMSRFRIISILSLVMKIT